MDQLAKELGLVRRGNRWIYRRRVPEDLVATFGRREIKESLGTEVYSEAKILRNEAATRWDREFAERRRQITTTTISSGIHRFVSERSRVDAERIRTSESETDCLEDALNETRELTRIYQNPDHELTQLAISSLIKDAFPHLLSKTKRGLSPIEQIDEDARVPDILSHLNEAEQTDTYDLLRKAVLERELRALDVLQGRPQAVTHQETFAAPGRTLITLQEATEEYLREHFASRPVNLKRQKSLKAEAAMMLHVIGPQVLISRIDRKLCREFRDTINCLPSNITKHFPNYESADLQALIAEATRKSLPSMKRATQSKYISMLKSVLKFAVAEEHLATNPAIDLTPLGVKTPPKHARDAFNSEDLKRIFNTAPYDKRPDNPRTARYWAALIGLFAGMRQNEICQLDIGDIRRTPEGIWFIDVNDDGEGKSVKNDRSRRHVPIHPELIKLGFVDFVLEEQAQRGTGKLFEEVRRAPDRNYGYLLSRWFNQTFLKNANAKTSKKSFHSLRHSFRDALRRARTPQDFVDQIGGWTSNGRAVTSENYGDGLRLSDLAQEAEKISYPGLDLSHLCKPSI